MDKPTNGYYVTINKLVSGAIIKIMGPYESLLQAEKVERKHYMTMHENYYTYSAWFGPDIEPVEEA